MPHISLAEWIETLNRAGLPWYSSDSRIIKHNADFAMDRVAASVIHDLRNPLAAICRCTEILLESKLAPSQIRRLTSNIQRAAGHMRDLLSDLARTTGGGTEAAETCDLRALVPASCDAASLGEREGIEILLDVPSSIAISVARTRIKRVFLNLIANAQEAMADGGTIRITAASGSMHNDAKVSA
jgi:signal transduction histidine kinase